MALGGASGRPQGLPKTGGRKEGTPNRTTLELKEKLARLGCDPAEGLAKIAQDPKAPLGFKLQAFATLMPYVYPKTKVADNSQGEGRPGDARQITKEQAIELARELLALLSPDISPQGKAPPGQDGKNSNLETECHPKPEIGDDEE